MGRGRRRLPRQRRRMTLNHQAVGHRTHRDVGGKNEFECGDREQGARLAEAAQVDHGQASQEDQVQHHHVWRQRRDGRGQILHARGQGDRNREGVVRQQGGHRDQAGQVAQVLPGHQERAAALRMGGDHPQVADEKCAQHGHDDAGHGQREEERRTGAGQHREDLVGCTRHRGDGVRGHDDEAGPDGEALVLRFRRAQPAAEDQRPQAGHGGIFDPWAPPDLLAGDAGADGELPHVSQAVGPLEERLHTAGRLWAAARGTAWEEICNGGPWPPERPDLRYPFRWLVLHHVAAWLAGAVGEPPPDFAALPVGLQAFLRSAAAGIRSPAAPLNAAAAARHLRDAEALAATWAPDEPMAARELTAAPCADSAAEMLAAVMRPTGGPTGLSEVARAALALLEEKALTLAEFGAFVRAWGRLPASVLEEIDAGGEARTWCANGQVGLSRNGGVCSGRTQRP